MKFTSILNNYDLFKKSFVKRKHLKRLFDKNNRHSISWIICCLFVSIPVFSICLSSLLFSSSIFLQLGFIISTLFFILILAQYTGNKTRRNINDNFKDNKLFLNYSLDNVFTDIEKNKKIFNLFGRKTNDEEIEMILDIEKISKKHKINLTKEYKKENKLGFFELELSRAFKAIDFSEEFEYNKFSFIHFVFKNAEVKDIQILSMEETQNILSDFTTEQQLILSSLIYDKVNNNKSKENELNDHLNIFSQYSEKKIILGNNQ
jgi:hypothetical protein